MTLAFYVRRSFPVIVNRSQSPSHSMVVAFMNGMQGNGSVTPASPGVREIIVKVQVLLVDDRVQ